MVMTEEEMDEQIDLFQKEFEDTNTDEINKSNIRGLIEWYKQNKLNLINTISDEDWYNLNRLENFLGLHDIENINTELDLVECIRFNSEVFNNTVLIPTESLKKLENTYNKIEVIPTAYQKVSNSLLTQEEINAVVILVKSGKINLDNIHRILTQEEINSISEILNSAKLKEKTL